MVVERVAAEKGGTGPLRNLPCTGIWHLPTAFIQDSDIARPGRPRPHRRRVQPHVYGFPPSKDPQGKDNLVYSLPAVAGTSTTYNVELHERLQYYLFCKHKQSLDGILLAEWLDMPC